MRQSPNEWKQHAYEKVKKLKETVASDPFRLHYHIMPPVGLINDPNGFVFYNDQYHIFYQWNPFETKHGAKFWGHCISDDLVNWKEAPIALAPDQWYDKDGCYSGSAIVYRDKLYVYYTGNVKDEAGNRKTYQCLAISEDGIHFEKKGPVIYLPKGYTAHFRDPKVFEKAGQWYMVLGAQTEDEKGEVVMYTSPDLQNWNFQGTLAGSGHNGLGDFGYMWECPDLIERNGKDILLVCPQGLEPKGFEFQNIFQSGYFAGKVDYDKISFEHRNFVELDRGFDFYAPQTTEDATGRRILFGWMGNAEEMDARQPTIHYEWIHALTLPRELEWKNEKLYQRPVEELCLLRRDEVEHSNVVVSNENVELPGVYGRVFELEIIIKDLDATDFLIEFAGNNQFHYDSNSRVCTFTRTCFIGDGSMESRYCALNELRNIRVFKDTSSVEIFINDGEEVFTSRLFDCPNVYGISFVSKGGKVTFSVKKWRLRRVTEY